MDLLLATFILADVLYICAAVSATLCGRFRLSQSSLILERTLERPLSSLDIVLILDCHFFIFSTLALIAGSRYLPCESRIVSLLSVVSLRYLMSSYVW